MIRWGIIGCGNVTEVKSGPALSVPGVSELVAVMRRNAAAAEDYARRHGVPRWSTDAKTILEAEDIDAVYIATPPSSHADYAIRAAAHGKHVLVEKPMALTVDECNAMIAASKTNERGLAVAFYRRALPRFEKLRDLVQSGGIGAPRSIYSCMHRPSGGNNLEDWKLDRDINGGGLFVDMQVHVLDWLQYVFGKPLEVAGVASNQGGEYVAEDTVSASIRYDDGVVASIDCCFESDRDEQFVLIRGTEGRVTMPFLRPGDIVLQGRGGEQSISIEDPAHVHQPFLLRLVEHFNGKADNPCPGEQGRDNIETVRTIVDGYTH